jgi:hypothetical protein
MRDRDKYRYIPLDVLTTPQDEAICKVNRWWLVEPTHGALIFRENTPQCNSSREILEHIRDGRELDIVFIPVAYFTRKNW